MAKYMMKTGGSVERVVAALLKIELSLKHQVRSSVYTRNRSKTVYINNFTLICSNDTWSCLMFPGEQNTINASLDWRDS